MSTTIITVLSIALYCAGIPVTSFILGRIKFVDLESCGDSVDKANTEMGLVCMHIFWPFTMPVYMFFYLSKKMYTFGITKSKQNKTKKNDPIPTKVVFLCEIEGSYREQNKSAKLIIDNVEQLKNNKYEFIYNNQSSMLIKTEQKTEQINIEQLLSKPN